MAAYELIGKTLAHSFSKPIHEALGAYEYDLRELPDENAVAEYLARRRFAGCNVTIPYKQTVMPLLDEVDEKAARIGAVNTIVNRGGRLTGYNTDYEGFLYMLERRGISLTGKVVLLLGSGGTAKTAAAVAHDKDAAELLIASRRPAAGHISYEEAAARQDVQIIINVSPAGMYPHNGQCLLPPGGFPLLEAVVDVVYNPLKTKLLLCAEALGVPTANGLSMLVAQAVAAARLYTGRPFGLDDTERVLREIYAGLANVTLIGMPSSGKSKLGQAAARKLKKDFIDLDEAIVKKTGRDIPCIFAEEGEAGFRRYETEVLQEATRYGGRVISTGGGVVTQPQNIPLLRQNGVVLYLDRPLEQLLVGEGRPLSTSAEALAAMYAARRPLYEKAADRTVKNDASFGRALRHITEAFYEVLDP